MKIMIYIKNKEEGELFARLTLREYNFSYLGYFGYPTIMQINNNESLTFGKNNPDVVYKNIKNFLRDLDASESLRREVLVI